LLVPSVDVVIEAFVEDAGADLEEDVSIYW
jgi:hypothetical protein